MLMHHFGELSFGAAQCAGTCDVCQARASGGGGAAAAKEDVTEQAAALVRLIDAIDGPQGAAGAAAAPQGGRYGGGGGGGFQGGGGGGGGGKGYSATYILELFRGHLTSRGRATAQARGHDRLEWFGAGAALARPDCEKLLRRLVLDGVLREETSRQEVYQSIISVVRVNQVGGLGWVWTGWVW